MTPASANIAAIYGPVSDFPSVRTADMYLAVHVIALAVYDMADADLYDLDAASQAGTA